MNEINALYVITAIQRGQHYMELMSLYIRAINTILLLLHPHQHLHQARINRNGRTINALTNESRPRTHRRKYVLHPRAVPRFIFH